MSRNIKNERENTDMERHRNRSASRRAKKRRRAKRRKIVLLILGILIVLGLAAGIFCLKYFEKSTGESFFDCIREGKEIAAASTADDFKGGSISYIYADDGSLIAELSGENDSTYLTYDEIPENVINAFISIEDRTFWTNKGYDLKGMVRVLYNYVKTKGQQANGASTITQQVIKLTYLSTEKTLSRKVKEIVIARELTKKYTKEQIIEFYCNACCFANGVYGIGDAAEAYFGKSVDELTLSETAYLCAIPNRPEYYNPKTNPENALTRRDKILTDMQEEGYITSAECIEAKTQTIAIAEVTDTDEDHNYETTYAMNCAIKYIMQLQGFTFRYSFSDDSDYQTYQDNYSEAYSAAKHELYIGGYKVYTTINMEAQKELQSILDEQLADSTDKTEEGIYQLQGAMTAIDNSTGKVIAIIGGRSQAETSGIYTLNRAYQGYAQPGSSIKPLVVYTPAMDTGEYNTASNLTNIDVEEAKSENLSASEIAEMDGSKVTLRSAVENSLNGCAYWLFANIGVKTGLSYIQNMNFSRIVPSDYNMSSCLGGLTYGVTTEEMANAYYTLENDGYYTDTDCIKSMLNSDGQDIYEEGYSKQIYSTEAARKMTDVMKGVLTNGTASSSRWYSYTDTEAAGKTGTTNDCKAAWFCGYTPYYTIAVWVGCDTPVSVSGLYGSSYPLSIWKNAMLSLIENKPAAYFPEVDADQEEETETEETCTCKTRCTADSIDEECPVCKKDYTKCACEEELCTCTEKCYGDSINEQCPVCLKDATKCLGAEPQCTCSYKCDADHIDQSCEACLRDINNCLGILEHEKETEKTETGGAGTTGGTDSETKEEPQEPSSQPSSEKTSEEPVTPSEPDSSSTDTGEGQSTDEPSVTSDTTDTTQ